MLQFMDSPSPNYLPPLDALEHHAGKSPCFIAEDIENVIAPNLRVSRLHSEPEWLRENM